MKTKEKSEMPSVFREGRRKRQCGVCGGVALEKNLFHHSSLCENRKFLNDNFTYKLFQQFFQLSLMDCLFFNYIVSSN